MTDSTPQKITRHSGEVLFLSNKLLGCKVLKGDLLSVVNLDNKRLLYTWKYLQTFAVFLTYLLPRAHNVQRVNNTKWLLCCGFMWSLVLFFVVLSGRFLLCISAWCGCQQLIFFFFFFLGAISVWLSTLFFFLFFNVFYLICNRPFELLLDLPQLKPVLPSVRWISF